MDYLWSGMMLVGIVWGLLTGRIGEVGEAALSGAGKGVTLCLTMLGALSLWTGLMKIAENAGLVEALTVKMKGVLHFLFPNIPDGHRSLYYIALNMIANILGLGWAATPAGLKGIEALAELEEERRNRGELCQPPGTANDEMCAFLVINISSLQLIPVTMIAYRMQYGSREPALITGPAILATLASTFTGVVFAKIAAGKRAGP